MESTGSDLAPAGGGAHATAESAPVVVKVVVAGGFSVGKTTFIGSISEIEPLSTEAAMTEHSLGVDESRPGVRELVQATLDLVRGLGLASTFTDDSARRRRILREWADVLDRELDRQEQGTT